MSKLEEGLLSGAGRFLAVDVEAVGLLHSIRRGDPSSLHVIHCIDMQTSEGFTFFDNYALRDPENREILKAEGTQAGSLEDGVRFIKECEAWSIHNGAGYDSIAFSLVFPELWDQDLLRERPHGSKWYKFFPYWFMDTYVMSTLLNPDRRPPPQAYAMGMGNVGAHSIEAHGIRIGRYKPENEDWSKLTDHMLHRCEEDVAIGLDYFWYLAKGEWSEHLARGAHRVTGLCIKSAYRMELQTALAMAWQAYRGFRLDTTKALGRYHELQKEIKETEAAFREYMPKRIKKKSLPKEDCIAWEKNANKLLGFMPEEEANELIKNLAVALEGYEPPSQQSYAATQWNPTNKGGNYSKNCQKYIPEAAGNINDYGELWEAPVSGAFTPILFEDIPLGNRDAVKQVLYKEGWLGVEYNETEQKHIDDYGELPNPWAGKINEASLDRWKERQSIPEWAEGIARWYILSSRSNQILNTKDVMYYIEHGEWPSQTGGRKFCRGLLPRAFNHSMGIEAQRYYELFGRWPETEGNEFRVPAVSIPIGTNTFRMRHRNVVNIPSRGLYPLRDLFIAGEGKVVLGCDGSGLELRMLAHFMNDLEYIKVVLDGDIHSYNQSLAGLPNRDMAKTFVYAFLYGSGNANLAAVTGMSVSEISARVDEFKQRLPALAKLTDALERAGRKFGNLLAVDGRWARIRFSDGKMLVHTILNVLLQTTGSLCMKWGLVLAEDALVQEGVGLDAMGLPALLANQHDEIQMEVDESEVLSMEYSIDSTAWKAEEKKTVTDAEGRVWSAPSIIKGNAKEDATITVQRKWHRAGQILAEKMTEAGEVLGIRIPLAGEYKIDQSWQETH